MLEAGIYNLNDQIDLPYILITHTHTKIKNKKTDLPFNEVNSILLIHRHEMPNYIYMVCKGTRICQNIHFCSKKFMHPFQVLHYISREMAFRA